MFRQATGARARERTSIAIDVPSAEIKEEALAALLQVVGKRVDVSLESELGDCPARTRIVAIGATDHIALRLFAENNLPESPRASP